MMKVGTKNFVTIMLTLVMSLSLMCGCLMLCINFAQAEPVQTAVTVSADDTLTGTAALTLTKVLGEGEEAESNPLEIYVDLNRVYCGPFAENINLDTTRLKNGTNRVIKAVYKTKTGIVEATKTVAIANDGGDSVVDPVQVITPEMMANFEWKNSSTVTVSEDGKYATITNCNIADPGTVTVDFGKKDALNTVLVGVKFYESNASGTVRRVRFRIPTSTSKEDDVAMAEANFDWAITDYNGDTNEFNGIDLRTVAGAESTRANIYGSTPIDITIMSDSGATVKVEYITVASYSPVPLATIAKETTKTAVTVSADDTLTGTAALTLTKVLGEGVEEVESNPLELYVDLNRVYSGPFAENIDLDTTRLKNGASRVIKVIYKTTTGNVETTKTVAIANDGGDSVVDPVQVITPEMMANFEWKNSSTVTVSEDGKYATITNCNIADPGTITVDFGKKDALNTVLVGVKFYESNASGTVRRVRFRIPTSTSKEDDVAMAEANFDWAITDYNGDTNEFNGIDLRTVAGAESKRANIYGATPIDITIMSDSGATIKVEYITVASYSPVPLATISGAPKIVVNEKAIDKFTQTENVIFDVDANSYALTNISGPYDADGVTLIEGDTAITVDNYVLSSGTGATETATIKLDYLRTLSVGKKYFRVENSYGVVLVCVDLTDTTPVPVDTVEITNKITSASLGGVFDFEVNINPENATEPSVIWSVSDPSIATINEETGALKFVKAGKVTITVTVIGKTVTGENDTAKTDEFEVIVSQSPIMPIITTPTYNIQAKNGLLVQVQKQVNDDQDTLEKMIVYVGGHKLYEGEYVPAFSVDTTKFANGLTKIRIEFDTANTDENAIAETQIHIVNDEYKICYPTIEEMAASPVDNEYSKMQVEKDIDNNILGVRFTQDGGTYAGFRAWTTPVQGADFTNPENIVMSFNVCSFEGANENSKIYTQIVVQNPNGIGRDIGINGLLDIKEAGLYTITLKEIFDREVEENRLPDYDLISQLTSVNFYYVIIIENTATAVVDQFALNYAFDDTDVDYSSAIVMPNNITVVGSNEKDYDVYTDSSNVTFEIDSDGLDVTITGNGIPADAYSFTGTTLTIYRSYLMAIGAGKYDFTVSSGVGEPVVVTINIIDTTPAAPEIIGEELLTFKKGEPADVTFKLDLKGAYISSVTGSDITTSDFVVDEEGNFTIKKEFLATCANGERSFKITTDGGFVTVKVNVIPTANNNNDAVTCGGSMYYNGVLMAVIAILCASVVMFVKTKKENI